jgi:lipoyl(octanoyl) transferase
MGLKVQVWVIREGGQGALEALLLKTTPERGGFWQPVTGSVEAEETLHAAAARELREETGIELDPPDLRAIGHAFEFESRWGGRVREEVFVAFGRAEAEVRMDPREHVDLKWVDIRQAEIFLAHESTKISLKKLIDFVFPNFSSREN